MVENVRKKRHKHISARQTADIFYELSDKNDNHIGGSSPADKRTESVKHKSEKGDVALAELLGKRPYGKNAYTHRYAADNGNEHLRYAVVVRSENVVAVINERAVFHARSDGIYKEIRKNYNQIFIRENRFELQ